MNILLLGAYEICFNPRLLKAAEYFAAKGHAVTVYSPFYGNLSKVAYNNFTSGRQWKIITKDLSKSTLGSYLRWAVYSIVCKLCMFLWRKRIPFGFEYALNRSVLGINFLKGEYDVILINLVDYLPAALSYKKRNTGTLLVYDSQEYFRGQYRGSDVDQFEWVVKAEDSACKDIDMILATTSVMKSKLCEVMQICPSRVFRVRNAPATSSTNTSLKTVSSRPETNTLRLVWHGFKIYYKNCRGLYLLIEAVAQTKCHAELFIQGYQVDKETEKIRERMRSLQIEDRIHFVPPANPEKLVESLLNYDVGVLGELPEQENQLLTSSNKLFEYVAAGLGVIAPNLPGIVETIDEFNCGIVYSPGDVANLAKCIDQLASDHNHLCSLKTNSRKARCDNLSWERDFAHPCNMLENMVRRKQLKD